MEKQDCMDPFLGKRVARYDRWLGEGQIDYSSKVVPVHESLEANQWVLPSERVKEILGRAYSVAVQPCECRTHYRRCDKPLDVCLLLNDVADRFVEKGRARPVDLSEAFEILQNANRNGLVHLTLYMPDHEVFAVCSCCPCCCHDLQIVKQYKRWELLLRSEYETVTDIESCLQCGRCAERCVFGARLVRLDRMEYNAGKCVGCGLCVTTCPVDAISMKLIGVEKKR